MSLGSTNTTAPPDGNRVFRRWTRPGSGLCSGVPAPILGGLFSQFVFKPVLRPVVRILSGLVAIPVFRFLLRRLFHVRTSNAEMERDLEHWFRAAVLLLAATANVEHYLFESTRWYQNSEAWMTLLPRLLLAIGVIEHMPDQDIFGILHRGPPRIRWSAAGLARAWSERGVFLRGLGVLHLKRSSPVLVIMAVVFGDKPGTTDFSVGWWCYGFAVTQYLIIALVTDRDRASGLLAEYDPEAANRRRHQITGAAGDTGCGQE